MEFSHDDKYLYMAAGEHARVKVFGVEVPATPKDSSVDAVHATPKALTENGAASGVHPLKDGRLVFTRSTLTSPNEVFLLSSSGHSLLEGAKERQLTAFSESGLKEKHLDKGTDLWWDGAKQKIQGWVVTPPGFKKGEKASYPVVMLIHGKVLHTAVQHDLADKRIIGGPQGAWEDQWSTRWNPQVWASAGYIAFLPNPTGSTTFGQELTDAIAGDCMCHHLA
jgi:dipeptidyl aminopeptidase/acylaminoacyl peptidase